MLSVGDEAPNFSLHSTNGGIVSLSDYKGKTNVVLYFYPKDDTPGCTKEACFFRDMQAEFEQAGAVILGVSNDSVKSHNAFAAKYHLPFPLLADEDRSVVNAYGVLKEKSNYGKTYLGIERTTFVIDKNGVVREMWPKVKVEGHIDEVLGFVQRLR